MKNDPKRFLWHPEDVIIIDDPRFGLMSNSEKEAYLQRQKEKRK